MPRLGAASIAMVLGCVGCRAAPTVRRDAAAPASAQMPHLELQRVSARLDDSPESTTGDFVIGSHGSIVMRDRRDDGWLYSVLDTAGSVVRRIGRIGAGPGEVEGARLVGLSDAILSVDDPTLSRIDQFTLDGRVVASQVTRIPVFARVVADDSELIGTVSSERRGFPALASMANGAIRQLVPTTDTFMLRSFPVGGLLPGEHVRAVKLAVLGRWTGGIIAADGWRYRLALYDWDGKLVRILTRDVPRPRFTPARVARELARRLARQGAPRTGPADASRMQREIADEPQPYFWHVRPLGLDGRGRIWVAGVAADSGYADVFSNTGFIGRVALPCRDFDGGWSLRGDWLVLACAPEDPDFAGDAVFKVFRLIG